MTKTSFKKRQLKKWFFSNWKWLVGVVFIPVAAILVHLFTNSSSGNVREVNVNEMSGGVIGDGNNFIIEGAKSFNEEHIKLIESRRKYINDNIATWYNYEDGEKYLYHFNILVDQLIEAAKNEESILFQEKLREIHFLSWRLERNEGTKTILNEEPGMYFEPVSNVESFLFQEETGILAGKVMNILIRGVNTSSFHPQDDPSFKWDCLYIYHVPYTETLNVFKYDTLFHYPSGNLSKIK